MAEAAKPQQPKRPKLYDHAWDIANLGDYHVPVPGSTEGGACLNRDPKGKDADGYYREHSCNHPWQAFMRAVLHDANIYNGDGQHRIDGDRRWYDPFLRGASAQQHLTRLFRLAAEDGGIKSKELPRPEKHGWDISLDGDNYRKGGNDPILHEAHHIVAAGELRSAIRRKVEGAKMEVVQVQQIRKGLLEAKYNLNHMDNMIILPVEEQFARAMGLPRHRLTVERRDHRTYSKYIRAELRKVLSPVQKEVQACKQPNYGRLRRRIVGVSKLVREQIKAKGLVERGKALDEVLRPNDAGSSPATTLTPAGGQEI